MSTKSLTTSRWPLYKVIYNGIRPLLLEIFISAPLPTRYFNKDQLPCKDAANIAIRRKLLA